MRKLIPLLLLAGTVAAQTPSQPDRLLIVPTVGTPERAETLVRAGLVFGWGDSFVVGRADETSLGAVRSKGWAHRVVPDPAGSQLYLVCCSSSAEVQAYGQIASLIHSSSTEGLVSATPTQAEALYDHQRIGLTQLVRLRREPLVQARQFDVSAYLRTGPTDQLTPHPDIQNLVSQVNQANLLSTVTTLSGYQTRRSDTATGVQAQNWLVSQFQSIPGLTVSLHDFDANADNVVAVLPGTVDPSKIVVIGGHYDSYAGGTTALAPGADDNASGTASVLECARLLSQMPFKYTIQFVCFASEEFGLYGSDAYARMLVSQNADVIAMVNTDMNAYRASSEPLDMVFISNDSSPALNAFGVEVINAYVPTLGTSVGSLSGGTSDHRSFNRQGYPACFLFEDESNYSPFIHSASDTIGTSANDFQLSEMITKSVLAMGAEIAVPAALVCGHTPLVSTTDTQGPYRVLATAASNVGSTITSVVLHGTDSNGSFSINMIPAVTADEWIADIPGQPAGTTVEYQIEVLDNQGHIARYPEGSTGAVSFRIGNRGAVYDTDFESGTQGWTHGQIATQDDWQLGTPQGNAGDPASAFSGANCWANDLGMSGWNGSYARNTHNWLRSPTIDCTGQTGIHLEFMRWLTVEDGIYDQARILVNGTEVWMNPATPGGGNDLLDTAWTPVDIDISHLADNNPSVQIEFRLQSDGGVEYGGWNIDDLALTIPQAPVLRTLVADHSFIALGAGSPLDFTIDLGSQHASSLYVLLAGYSGTSPGIALGGTVVPVNYDPLTELVLTYITAAPVFNGFTGQLDASGMAQATLALPAGSDSAMVGMTLYFAGVTLTPTIAATSSVEALLIQ